MTEIRMLIGKRKGKKIVKSEYWHIFGSVVDPDPTFLFDMDPVRDPEY